MYHQQLSADFECYKISCVWHLATEPLPT